MSRHNKDEGREVARPKPFKKKKFKRIINQITSITREVLTIYSLTQTKNPLSIGLGIISSIGLIYDHLELYEPIGPNLVKKKGYQSYSDMDADLIYNTLKHIEIDEKILMKDEENDSSKIVEFSIRNVDILFYLADNDIYGPFLKDKNEFTKVFSEFVFDKLGNMIKIESKMIDNYEQVKFSPLDIGTDIYISSINEEKLVKKIQMFRDRGFNRSLLFCGPPGVGKTTLVGRLVKQIGGKLVVLHPDTIDTIEMSLLSLLNLLDPDVILFDDIDRITEFNDTLAYLEELNKSKGANRLIIGTVNNLRVMPGPMKRPGRFDRIIEFDSPTDNQIEEMLLAYADKYDVEFTKENLPKIKKACRQLTPAYIDEIAKRRIVENEEDLLEQIKEIHKLLGDIKEDDE